MSDKPLETKATDILAAAAGVPTPTQVTGLWSTAWRHRKLALLLAGVGLTATAGGYGYKYFTTTPGKASAQDDPPAVAAKPDDDTPPVRPLTTDDPPPIPEIKIPSIDVPVVKPVTDRTVISPLLVLPPMGDSKKPATGDETPPIEPPIPEIKLPASDKKKAGDEASDQFKSADVVPIVGPIKTGPAPLPGDTIDRKDNNGGGPVIRVQGMNPSTDVPKVEAPGTAKKDDPTSIPAIPTIDIPPAPATIKVGDSPIVAPPPAPDKDDTIPPITIPGPKPDVPPVIINPLSSPEVKTPEIKTPEIPTITIPDRAGPPAGVPTIDVPSHTPPTPPTVAAPTKRDSYDELWHDDKGETFAAISREYFHDPKYAAALEAYNKGRRDKTIRVPPTWVLEEQFPNLVNKANKPDKADKPTGTSGLKFEPVAPLSSSGRTVAPPTAVTSRSNDEYRVTNESGEMIRDVARKVLGDAAGWKKLYDLNQGIDPTLPIPAGTTLRLN